MIQEYKKVAQVEIFLAIFSEISFVLTHTGKNI